QDDSPRMKLMRGEVQYKLARTLASARNPSSGFVSDAMDMYTKSSRSYLEAIDEGTTRTGALRGQAACAAALSDLYREADRFEEARGVLNQAYERVRGSEQTDLRQAGVLLKKRLAAIRVITCDLDQAEREYKEALAILDALSEASPGDMAVALTHADTRILLSIPLSASGRFDEAEREVRAGLYEGALVIQQLSNASDRVTMNRAERLVTRAHSALAEVLLAAGRADESVAEFEVAIDRWTAKLSSTPGDLRVRRFRAPLLSSLALAHLARDDPAAAGRAAMDALRDVEQHSIDAPEDPTLSRHRANALVALAATHIRAGEFDSAEDALREAKNIALGLHASDSGRASHTKLLGEALTAEADLLRQRAMSDPGAGRWMTEAINACRSVIDHEQRIDPTMSGCAGSATNRAKTEMWLSELINASE
ncbi:MAG: hypothetical protein K8E66_03145, partial [Phycisphaerales bacterium]|nr:hypothetical protein [Phycisphaerales bacterium]